MDEAEVFLAAHPAAAGDDDAGTLQVDLAGLAVPFDEFDRQVEVVELDLLFDDLARALVVRRRSSS